MRGIVHIAENKKENHVILLNANKSQIEQNYHGFHEFTHILTTDEPGTTINCFEKIKPNQNTYIEWLANEGAAEFVMPYREILPIIKEESKSFDSYSYPVCGLIEYLAYKYNVSTIVAKNRIVNLSYEIWQHINGVNIDDIEIMSFAEQKRNNIHVDSLLDIEDYKHAETYFSENETPKPFFSYSNSYKLAIV